MSNWNPDPGQQPYGQQPGPSPYGGQQQGPYGGQGQSPYGQGDPYGQNPYGQNPYGQNPYTPSAAARGQRPGSVTAAATLAFVGSGLVLLVGIPFLLVSLSDSLIEDLPYDEDFMVIARIIYGTGIILSLIAIPVAVAVLKRKRRARTALTVLAALTIVVSIIGLPGGIVTIALAIASLITMWQRSASEWFRGSGPIHGVPGYGGPQQGDPYGGQQYGQQYGQQPGYGSSPQGGGDQPPSQKPWG